ncbi:MAG: TIGR03809 family protein [Xanthobacteraceae bacterium]
MAFRQPSPYGAVARDWLSLVERRKAHLIELFETGRWRHYYTETELLSELRAVNLAHDRFANVAGLPRQTAESAVPS